MVAGQDGAHVDLRSGQTRIGCLDGSHRIAIGELATIQRNQMLGRNQLLNDLSPMQQFKECWIRHDLDAVYHLPVLFGCHNDGAPGREFVLERP